MSRQAQDGRIAYVCRRRQVCRWHEERWPRVASRVAGSPMECYACDREATDQCPRCGLWFCREHGNRRCARCQERTSLPPPALLYRSALALLVLSVGVASWHILVWPQFPAPPSGGVFLVTAAGEGGEKGGVNSLPSDETSLPSTSPTASAQPEATPTLVTIQATPTATPKPTSTPLPTPTATAEPRRYIVETGDTLTDIAERFGTTLEDLIEANDIEDPETVIVGQELVLP